MKSINFEFLRADWPNLAEVAARAELAAHEENDAVASLMYQRLLIEQIVEMAYVYTKLSKRSRATLNDLLNDKEFRSLVKAPLATSLCYIKDIGNRAVHANKGTKTQALESLAQTHEISLWFFKSFAKEPSPEVPLYKQATQEQLGITTKSGLKRERTDLLQRKSELEQWGKKLEAERDRLQALVTDQQAALDRMKATQAIDMLHLDEAETRKLIIDQYLLEAGWNLNDKESVSQEYVVDGEGHKADYVLWDRDKEIPLAVIEAKKTSIDPLAGKEQARLYADSLEEKCPGHRPVIFYTNGHETNLWDDARKFPPRQVYGFYSRESLVSLIALRKNAVANLSSQKVDETIIDRHYQTSAVNKVLEGFQERRRKALIVQATGTGKTRVAIALCKAMMQAGWCRRILFLCDRRELRKQAKNNFEQFIGEKNILCVITAGNAGERDKNIYFATYQTMMDAKHSYDIGFFDLIIADESHRSIYNRYGEILQYFDACQVGLTATPKNHIESNTFRLFNCDEGDPTYYFSYEDAIKHKPPYLATFNVKMFQTEFMRRGIKYNQLNARQQRQIEEQELVPDEVNYEAREVDRFVFNIDTNRRILRNLMEEGLRGEDGAQLGKTIIFARNHAHAILLCKLFHEMYPQYGGAFCQVIDNYEVRAEELIDDFKGVGKHNDLVIAISVDMLDTGIDVPEILNLVFAKPVYSIIKFWQMIGRGTRLCANLFGPGKHKKEFLIFDHWGICEYFDEVGSCEDIGTRNAKSLQQLLFENRISLAEAAIENQDVGAFNLAKTLIQENLQALPEKSISVRSHWKEVNYAKQPEVLNNFDAGIKKILDTVAPLMQWVNISGSEEAWKFDALCCMIQVHKLRGSSIFNDKRDKLIDWVSRLKITLNIVRERIKTIEKVKDITFWENVTVQDIENIRQELRGIVQYADWGTNGIKGFAPTIMDIAEDEAKIVTGTYQPKSFGLDQVIYRNRVEEMLRDLVEKSSALQKIRAAEPVSQADIQELAALIIAQEPDLTLDDLKDYYPHVDKVESILFEIVGIDPELVSKKVDKFIQDHQPQLNSIQIQYLELLCDFIHRNGRIELDDLYSSPFTTFSPEGVDGIFPSELSEELKDLIESFRR